MIVRPVLWFGRFADTVLERGVIAGGLTDGTVGRRARRLGRGPPRADRVRALLRRRDDRRASSGVALYFLISAS